MAPNLKILLILVNFNRPKMVRFMLNSIKEQDYKNWFLSYIDDSSDIPQYSIVEEILGEEMGACHAIGYDAQGDFSFRHYNKAICYRLEDTRELKRQRGSRHPQLMNHSILESPNLEDADVVCICCDDDALFPGYLSALNEYYKANPEVNHSFCHVVPYDPMIEGPDPSQNGRPFWLNHGKDMSSANCIVDSSQVTYRRKYFTQMGVRYPSPAFRALDSFLYAQLDRFGPVRFNGIVGQYKGSFNNQLSYRTVIENEYYPIDTEMI